MKNENFEEYMNEFIEFYKTIKLNGYSVEDLRKLIIRNLHDIKRKGLKELNIQKNIITEQEDAIKTLKGIKRYDVGELLAENISLKSQLLHTSDEDKLRKHYTIGEETNE